MIFHWRSIGLGPACRTLACAALLALPLSVRTRTGAAAVRSRKLPSTESRATHRPGKLPIPTHRPGFLDALGRWLGNSTDAVDPVKSTQDRLGTLGSQATGAAKDAAQAAGSAVGLPGNRIVTGRQICGVAPNGGADCQPAADTLCRSKGFEAAKAST